MNIGVKSPTFFYTNSSKQSIRHLCKVHWEEEMREVIYRADLATDQTFIFTHRWDMERCETPVSFPDKVDWTYQYQNDFEWTVNLNRGRFMAELGQAYWLTDKEKYAEAFIKLMKDWMEQNPLTEQEIHDSEARHYNVKDTWRKLDSGIRITNWIKGYYCVRESVRWGKEEESLFQKALSLHGMYLHIAYLPHDKQSNWGFLETNGLFQIGLLFPNLSNSSTWLQTAINRLEKMCSLQVFNDGMHNEQSPMYHHEVLHCLFEPVALARKNEITLPESLTSSLDKLLSASLGMIKPNGRQPMLSDSDDTNIRDVLTRGAVLLERGDLKHQGYTTLDFEGIWYFGEQGFTAYNHIKASEPSYQSLYYEQSGYAIMRNSWDSDGHYLLFDGGHMDIVRAHGHDDFLHVDLHALGADFLIDTGRFTYKENEERRYFKESINHNTISVDNQTISTYVDSWTWQDVAKPVHSYWKSTNSFDYVEGSHNGYHRLDDPVDISRKILYRKPHYWVIVDTCKSKDAHDFHQHFHFSEDNLVTVHDEGHIQARASNGACLDMVSVTNNKWSTETCWVSRHYNEKNPSTKVVSHTRGSGLTTFITFFFPGGMDKDWTIKDVDVFDTRNNLFSKDDVTALQVDTPEGKDTLLFSHHGPNSFQMGGYQLTGEVLFIKDFEELTEFIIKV
ncbi:alginate lyase family protein [Pontibacillus salicampi]|uniref:Alginate lyase family protein n=1 Tax=Pontibacillus salicampi TaxID=1449801 RepID=A0ABV6LRH5_9BACI